MRSRSLRCVQSASSSHAPATMVSGCDTMVVAAGVSGAVQVVILVSVASAGATDADELRRASYEALLIVSSRLAAIAILG